jgi:hypothetical protein
LAVAGALHARGHRRTIARQDPALARPALATAKLAKRRLKRGVFRSIVDLQAAINRFLDEANQDPKPFIWTADPDKIIAAVRRGHQVLDSLH